MSVGDGAIIIDQISRRFSGRMIADVTTVSMSFACCLIISAGSLLADGPGDNSADNVRQVPPPGIEVPADIRESLQGRLAELKALIDDIKSGKPKPNRDLLADVEVYHRAVDQALRFNELFSKGDLKKCDQLLDEGIKRATALKAAEPYWVRQTGRVVRGFYSKLDGTVQPYGIEVPAIYQHDGEKAFRCDLWFHGRGERAVELQFISQRMNGSGPYQLDDGFVLHPFGRYSNAFKFAGEVDVFEALEHAKKWYRIDDDRVSVRGFSMGGAGCWHFAVHHADQFFAANPGAGFSETPKFLKFFQGEKLNPPEYEERMWNLYDAPEVVENLAQVPTIVYSGEIDRQKQAADVMVDAAEIVGLKLMHVIGPETAHKIHPDSNRVIAGKMDALANRGRVMTPRTVRFSTHTLKYNRMNWVEVSALKEHWKRGLIRAEVVPQQAIPGQRERRVETIRVSTFNISEFTIDFPAGSSPFELDSMVRFEVNGGLVAATRTASDGSLTMTIHRNENGFKKGPLPVEGLRKKHDLQGPIDDALMSSFLFVKPTGIAMNETVGKWTDSERDHAVTHWRQQMRGDARVKDDTEITDEDIAAHNLILWGCPESNAVIKKVLPQLPIEWSTDGVIVGEKTFDAGHHAPVLIYPNPLNPEKYVVINSSFTYREYDYLNNARQMPKLPDWAVIDLRTPPNSRWPGKVTAADFFDESWKLK